MIQPNLRGSILRRATTQFEQDRMSELADGSTALPRLGMIPNPAPFGATTRSWEKHSVAILLSEPLRSQAPPALGSSSRCNA